MSDDYKETILPDAFKDLPKTIPVIWDYRWDEIIGSAVVNADGTATFTITDPRVIRAIEQDHLRDLRSMSIHHEPAVPKVKLDPAYMERPKG